MLDRFSPFRFASGAVLAALVLCTGLTLPTSGPARAQAVQRIAAVVNDRIISVRDVEMRMDLLMTTSNVPDTQGNRRQLLPRVVRSLIDERLKMQEAERLGISVDAQEVEHAKRQIEQSNGMPSGMLDRILSRASIPSSTLDDQLRAEVAWIKIVRNRLSRDISVEPAEIDAVLETMRGNLGKPERLLSEIVLAPESVQDDSQAAQTAQRLVAELRDGADFAAIARQFSSTATAGSGGDLGWVPQGSMAPELEDALRGTTVGGITDPVRTTTGYTILKLRDQRTQKTPDPRDLKVHLSQLYMPTRGQAAVPAATRNDTFQALKDATSCRDIDKVAEEMRLPSSGDIGIQSPSDLPAPVRNVVVDLPEGKLSAPIAIDGAEILVMVCERENPDGLPSRDEIEDRLMRTKLERAAQRALRDLRNQALIDIRL